MSQLVEKIVTRILQEGPIPFRDFMEMALYDLEQGYYSRLKVIGPRGDYYTNTNIHPLFGELLADKLASLLTTLHTETELAVVEVGAGTGQLAEDILHCFQEHYPGLSRSLTYVIAERSPAFRLVQRERLGGFGCVRWRALTEFEPGSMSGVIFSNELIDALPVHRVVRRGREFRELFVDWRGGRFVWVPGDLSTDELRQLVSGWEGLLEEGQMAEVNLSAVQYLCQAASVLREGYVVTIDYGEVRPRLYSPARREGTLRCFYQHTLTDNPFERIGEQDITASVDFTLLMESGEQIGLPTVEFKRQREFMLEQGLIDRLQEMDAAEQNSLASLKSKLAAKHLLMPGALGDHFKLLIQKKSYG
jgi:SAM-dependent MidA family methyltransferase